MPNPQPSSRPALLPLVGSVAGVFDTSRRVASASFHGIGFHRKLQLVSVDLLKEASAHAECDVARPQLVMVPCSAAGMENPVCTVVAAGGKNSFNRIGNHDVDEMGQERVEHPLAAPV